MVDLEKLAARARRAAEWGRARRASRLARAVVPLTLLALALAPAKGAVVSLGIVLLLASLALAWKSRLGEDAARAGLKVGALPMTIALVAVAVERWCAPGEAASLCGVGCLLAGALAGGASAWQASKSVSQERLVHWGQIGLIASLTSALGCVGLGLGSTLAILGAMLAGAAAAWLPLRAE